MRDRVEQYQVQNAVKENLIQMLQDVFREQEEKIETLENHTQGRVRTHPNPAKPSQKSVKNGQLYHLLDVRKS